MGGGGGLNVDLKKWQCHCRSFSKIVFVKVEKGSVLCHIIFTPMLHVTLPYVTCQIQEMPLSPCQSYETFKAFRSRTSNYSHRD